MSLAPVSPDRHAELAANLDAARDRVAAACIASHRNTDDVELLVVTKFFPAEDVAALIDLGVLACGESREPEASRKVAEIREHINAPVAFDMIGQLQRRKAKSVARWAKRVHSVDSVRLVDALATGAEHALADGNRSDPIDVLVQANLDGDPSRGGAIGDDIKRVADAVTANDNLRLSGVMVIAPQSRSAEHWMAVAADVHGELVAEYPAASTLSAGMSGDLEQAITYGSTCVRVGTAILGKRPLPLA